MKRLEHVEKLVTMRKRINFARDQREIAFPDPSIPNQPELVTALVEIKPSMRFIFDNIRDMKPPIIILNVAFQKYNKKWINPPTEFSNLHRRRLLQGRGLDQKERYHTLQVWNRGSFI